MHVALETTLANKNVIRCNYLPREKVNNLEARTSRISS